MRIKRIRGHSFTIFSTIYLGDDTSPAVFFHEFRHADAHHSLIILCWVVLTTLLTIENIHYLPLLASTIFVSWACEIDADLYAARVVRVDAVLKHVKTHPADLSHPPPSLRAWILKYLYSSM